MIVYDLDCSRLTVAPFEAYPILVIDPYRVLALAVAMQCFKAVTGRDAEVVECVRLV
jgi:hypothetical protein